MPRTAEQNQKIKDARRMQILKSALPLFAKVGYRKVSVDLITRETGCSHGLFYHYFDSKEDVFRAILDETEAFGFSFARLRKIAEMDVETLDKTFFAFFDNMTRAGDTYMNFISVLFSHHDNEILKEYFTKNVGVETMWGFFNELVKKGQAAGVLIEDLDSKELARLICIDILGFINVYNMKEKNYLPSSLGPTIAEFIKKKK